MPVAFHAQRLQPLDEGLGVGLPGVLGDDHAAHIEAQRAEHVDKPQHVLVIGDTQIAPHLALFDIPGADGHHDLHLVLHGAQHADLAVGLEPRQHAAGVMVVKQLAAELQIQLAAELCAALADVLCLHGQVLLVVKAQLHPIIPHFDNFIIWRVLYPIRRREKSGLFKFAPLKYGEIFPPILAKATVAFFPPTRYTGKYTPF